MIARAIASVVEGHDLDAATMEAAFTEILTGEAGDARVAALAIALRMKGETAEEIAAAARVMRARCDRVELDVDGPLLDTAGTGGDGAGSVNVSTLAALVAAACGVAVAKHGNRAVSSRAGSADLLAALGVPLGVESSVVRRQVEEAGFGFLFAPAHHAALKHAAPVRRALGVRTFFNLLGPLSNPAGATHQIVGVYDASRVEQMARCLGLLGVEAAWVVHGEGGLDEISPSGPTAVARLSGGRVERATVRPEDFGVSPRPPSSIAGGDAEHNARIARALLAGEDHPAQAAVVLNAAAALHVAGAESSLRDAAARALDALRSGAAAETLAKVVAIGAGEGG